MKEEKTPKPNLPVIKAYPDDFEMILKCFAISDTIDDALANENFKRRLDAIPHATSGMRMMQGRMLQMVHDLTATLPFIKRRSLLRMHGGMKYRVYCRMPVGKLESGDAVLSNDELGALCKFAKAGNCDVCFEQNCNRCKLGKLFDSILPYDRDKDETWSNWIGWVDMP